jgi:hypothetical protein
MVSSEESKHTDVDLLNTLESNNFTASNKKEILINKSKKETLGV